MNKSNELITSIVLVLCLMSALPSYGQREMEFLRRGTVAVRTSNSQVFVSWRMLGPEYAQNATYNLYRDGSLIAADLQVTNYTDYTSSSGIYSVSAVINGAELAASTPVSAWNNFYTTVPLSPPSSNHHANDASVGDLDGDGDYELVLKWEANNSRDNSQSGTTDVVYLDGLEMDGTLKWRMNLGINIRAGAHYTQFMVYDLDGDGKAEVALKTAPGTRDGTGSYLQLGPAANDNDAADYRNSAGYVLSGPEYLTIFNGETGTEMATTSYIPARGNVNGWGDGYGNRVDRFLACIAYLDGSKPSLVMCRGYYERSALAAWDWRNGNLTSRWVFDTNNGYSAYEGQGNHGLSVNDVDNDGRDEIIYGAMAIDDDGSGLWNSDLKHGDAMHVSDIDVNRPGLERWGIHENDDTPGAALLDAQTGAIIWQTPNADVGRGVAADIDPSSPGMECWGGTSGLRSATNTYVGPSPASSNFVIWWDGDLSRELCDADRIDKYENGSTNRLVTIYNYENSSTNNGTKKNPCLQADILGDWREELITRSSDNSKLIIFTTTDPTSVRMYTLMHDPAYRLGVAWQNVSYNQPPHTGFFLGTGMGTPPVPNISLISPADQAVTGVSLTPTSQTIGLGATLQLAAVVQPANATDKNVSWSSSNPSIATVSQAGQVTGVEYGIATITVTTVDGNFSASSLISVEAITTLKIQENETGFDSYDGFIESNHIGHSGDGFVNTPNAIGEGINWQVCILDADDYTFSWRYANGVSTDRTASVLVDGAVVASNVSFPSTGDWIYWNDTQELTVSLSAGVHLIRLEATGTSGLANIDYFSVTGTSLQPGQCATTSFARVTGELDHPFREPEVAPLKVFPNPARHLLTMEFGWELTPYAVVQLYDPSGRLQLSKKAKGQRQVLDVSNLPSGLYFLRVSDHDKQVMIKVFRE